MQMECIGKFLRRNLLERSSGLISTKKYYLLSGSGVIDQTRRSIHRGNTPRRAILYVPANDTRKVEKISNLTVDCAVLDCEDGVAINKKMDARDNIPRILPGLLENAKGEICVRVNSVSSRLLEDDLCGILSSKLLPHSLMLPKVEKWEDIKTFFSHFNPVIKQHHYQLGRTPHMKFVIFIETALGLVNLKEIIESTIAHSVNSILCFEGIVFGSDDFCASIGVERSPDSHELLYARQKIVTYAKAFDLQAIDMVYINYKDLQGLEKQSLEGAQMGFTGKQIIHPGQVDVVQKCFSPSKEKIEFAEALIQAFNEHQAAGRGAFSFRGRMIDMPLLKQAESILKMRDLVIDNKE